MSGENKNTTTKTSTIGCGIVTFFVFVLLYLLSIRGVLYIEDKSWYAENSESDFHLTLRSVTQGYRLPVDYLRKKNEQFNDLMYWYLDR